MIWAIDFIVVLLAILVGEFIYDGYKNFTNRNVAAIMCDACKKPRKTRRSKDKKYWLCRTCKALYDEEQS